MEDQPDIVKKYNEMLYGYKWKTKGKPFLKVERVSAERCSVLHGGNSPNPEFAKKIRRRLTEGGCPIRLGKFLPGEDDIIAENLQNYHKDYPENNPLVMLHKGKSIKGIKSIVDNTLYYSRIAEGLNRTIRAVYLRARYILFPDVYVIRKGRFTANERNNFRQLYKKHGPSWKLIGSKLGRSESGLTSSWLHLQGATKFGHWDPTEDRLLTDSVKKHSNNVETDLHSSLPWISIAKAVPGRSTSQCRTHWMSKLRQNVFQKEHHFDTLSWSNDQNMELITQICNQSVRYEEDVDFDAIRQHLEKDGFVVSNGQISKQWRQLKMKVNKYSVKSFEEILDEVSELVVSQIADT